MEEISHPELANFGVVEALVSENLNSVAIAQALKLRKFYLNFYFSEDLL